MVTVLAGLGLGLSLIVAIGAQNVFVLRQGLRREHVGLVVAICAVSDAVLIAAGVAGVGAAIAAAPRAPRPGGTDAATPGSAVSASTTTRTVVATCLAFTWLNPHVYLDTVVLLGTVAASHGDARWMFGLGAALGSVLWFAALGYGARLLSGVLARPGAWRVLDGLIAVVMSVLAVSLVVGA